MVGRSVEVDDETNQISEQVIGAAIEVHRQLGPGHKEVVYEEALAYELRLRGVAFERQKPVKILYKQHLCGDSQLDLVVAGKVVVELKAVEKLHPQHSAQCRSYLVATGLQLGLVLNFNAPRLIDGLDRVIETRHA